MSGEVGFYGKLPGAGDFVRRRLTPAFVDDWDRHFQHALETGRRELGDRWTHAWRHGAPWRFMLPAQVCGYGAWCGLVGPAVDRLGRTFPLVLAAPCTGDAGAIFANEAWFDALERIYLSALHDAVSVETFDAWVASLGGPAKPDARVDAMWTTLPWHNGEWLMTPPAGAATGMMLAETWTQLSLRPGPWCLWWTATGTHLLATRGLPRSYAVLLAHGSQQVNSLLDVPAMHDAMPPLRPEAPPLADDADLGMDFTVDVAANPQASLLMLDHDHTVVLSADEGSAVSERCAARRIREVALASQPELPHLRSALLMLHSQLRLSEQTWNRATTENGVALIARFEGSCVRLLRIGAGAAWLWRRGQLLPLFVERAAGAGGEFDDLLFGDAWIEMPGIGAAGELDCDEADILLEPGDRLLMLVTRELVQLPRVCLAEALALPGQDDARVHLAACAGLGGPPDRWPLAVIGVGA